MDSTRERLLQYVYLYCRWRGPAVGGERERQRSAAARCECPSPPTTLHKGVDKSRMAGNAPER